MTGDKKYSFNEPSQSCFVSMNIQKCLDTLQSTCSRININIMTVMHIVTTAQNNKYQLFLWVLCIGLNAPLLQSCTALTWLASHCIVGTLVRSYDPALSWKLFACVAEGESKEWKQFCCNALRIFAVMLRNWIVNEFVSCRTSVYIWN